MEYAGWKVGDVFGAGGFLPIILEEITAPDGHSVSDYGTLHLKGKALCRTFDHYFSDNYLSLFKYFLIYAILKQKGFDSWANGKKGKSRDR